VPSRWLANPNPNPNPNRNANPNPDPNPNPNPHQASFLPGVGGKWGVPMWAFYVNRGQGMATFGVENKDGGIALFQTAEKTYQVRGRGRGRARVRIP